MQDNDLFTIGQIADTLAEPMSRVAYVIGKYRIKHVARVGIIRLFSEQQVEAIRQYLYGIQIRGGR